MADALDETQPYLFDSMRSIIDVCVPAWGLLLMLGMGAASCRRLRGRRD